MKRVHLMGIGGVGMAGLAFLLKRAGHRVTGCDKYASDRTRWLETNGIAVAIGHDSSHVNDVDEMIVTPAVPSSESELATAKATPSLRLRYRGEVLAELVNAADGVAVCGTHGKTTTSTFATRLLQALGDAPSWCIGGETGAMPVAGPAQTGASANSRLLVVEADESDGTLALYRPQVLVLNAVDFDHLEHFASPAAYFECYRTVIRQTRSTVIVCAEHPQALALAREALPSGIRLLTFGDGDKAEINARDWPQLASLVLGRHNVLNALAAIAVAVARGHSTAAISAALPFALSELPDRRFQLVAETAESPSVRVYTDYAHHPAELKCAVDMAKQLHPRRLRVLFQPHRYSRTRALLQEFPPAFAQADELVLIPVYAAFESPLPGGDIADLYRAFREDGSVPKLLLARSTAEAWRHVLLTAQPDDLILIAGAGDIVNILPRVRVDLSKVLSPTLPERSWTPLAPCSFFRTGGSTCGGGEPLVVGMGSNTWISDCATDSTLIRPELPPGASLIAKHPALAFMAGIPGTIGGWVKMNAGAFGHSISEFVESVTVRLDNGDTRTIPATECGFGYRQSSIPGTIVDVTLSSSSDSCQTGIESAADYLARRKRFPARTCGSVFKNPSPDHPAGRLLEAAGAKTLRVGGARVWEKHANVIVAEDGCTSSDILALARLMANAVFFNCGIRLEPEIRGL